MPCPAVEIGNHLREDRKRLHDIVMTSIMDSNKGAKALMEFSDKYGYLCLKFRADEEGNIIFTSDGI